ncbi:hypothetical protein B0H10DRAFT_2183035 [Mycena sp. CBHHK59/15]|nr:hypothetical protein B0H10DRAFT_2183035 [Mycena sp. CBHHK59/15]
MFRVWVTRVRSRSGTYRKYRHPGRLSVSPHREPILQLQPANSNQAPIEPLPALPHGFIVARTSRYVRCCHMRSALSGTRPRSSATTDDGPADSVQEPVRGPTVSPAPRCSGFPRPPADSEQHIRPASFPLASNARRPHSAEHLHRPARPRAHDSPSIRYGRAGARPRGSGSNRLHARRLPWTRVRSELGTRSCDGPHELRTAPAVYTLVSRSLADSATKSICAAVDARLPASAPTHAHSASRLATSQQWPRCVRLGREGHDESARTAATRPTTSQSAPMVRASRLGTGTGRVKARTDRPCDCAARILEHERHVGREAAARSRPDPAARRPHRDVTPPGHLCRAGRYLRSVDCAETTCMLSESPDSVIHERIVLSRPLCGYCRFPPSHRAELREPGGVGARRQWVRMPIRLRGRVYEPASARARKVAVSYPAAVTRFIDLSSGILIEYREK